MSYKVFTVEEILSKLKDGLVISVSITGYRDFYLRQKLKFIEKTDSHIYKTQKLGKAFFYRSEHLPQYISPKYTYSLEDNNE